MNEIDIKMEKSKLQIQNSIKIDIKRIEDKQTAILKRGNPAIDKNFNKALDDIWG